MIELAAVLASLLAGKKTYLCAIGLVATALGQFAGGDIDLLRALEQCLTGMGLAAVRMGIQANARVEPTSPLASTSTEPAQKDSQ